MDGPRPSSRRRPRSGTRRWRRPRRSLRGTGSRYDRNGSAVTAERGPASAGAQGVQQRGVAGDLQDVEGTRPHSASSRSLALPRGRGAGRVGVVVEQGVGVQQRHARRRAAGRTTPGRRRCAISWTTPVPAVRRAPAAGRQPGVQHLGTPSPASFASIGSGRPTAICASQRCTAVSWAIRRCQKPAFFGLRRPVPRRQLRVERRPGRRQLGRARRRTRPARPGRRPPAPRRHCGRRSGRSVTPRPACAAYPLVHRAQVADQVADRPPRTARHRRRRAAPLADRRRERGAVRRSAASQKSLVP